MSCRRAYEIDLPAFLEDPGTAAFADFREHYPGCASCAAELRAWTELDLRLRAAAPGDGVHPDPARLAAYARESGALGAGERGDLDAHLRRCAPCRDELAGLRRFLEAGAPSITEARERPGAGLLGALRGLLWQPALAYALLALVLAPTLYRSVGPGGTVREEVETVLRGDRPAPERAQQQRAPTAEAAPELALAEADEVAAADSEERDVPKPTAKQVAAPKRRIARAQAERRPAASPPARPAAEPPAPRASNLAPSKAEAGEGSREPKREAEDVGRPLEALADAAAPVPLRDRELQSRRALGYLDAGPRAGAQERGRADAAFAEAPATLDLDASRTLRVAAAALASGLRIRVPIPAQADPLRVEITVTAPDGARELRERHTLRHAAEWVETALPAAWLEPGVHVVRVAIEGDPPEAARVYRFAVD